MGYTKQKQIELEESNISNVPDKNVCVKHFEDKSIKYFIRKNYSLGHCDYCNKEVKVVSFEMLLNFIMTGISNFYEDAANFMNYESREGGYFGDTYTPEELILEYVELITDPFEISEDIINSIENIAWAKPDLYYDNQSDELLNLWNYFKNIIKHKSRYLFKSQNVSSEDEYSDAFKILYEVGKITKRLNLIQKINKGTKIYRCRQHNFSESEKLKNIEELVSPIIEKAIYSNRFSPSGISMLYSAFDECTAILETVKMEDKKMNRIAIPEFILDKDIFVIDFNKLPEMPSIFNYKKIKNYYLISFLYDLVRDFTMEVVKDGKEHIGYVPTQVVTEFFRFPFNKNRKNKIEGLIGKTSHIDHRNLN